MAEEAMDHKTKSSLYSSPLPRRLCEDPSMSPQADKHTIKASLGVRLTATYSSSSPYDSL
jgi:hypothetical protein